MRFICPVQLLFCGTLSSVAFAQERMVLDLQLPPAVSVQSRDSAKPARPAAALTRKPIASTSTASLKPKVQVSAPVASSAKPPVPTLLKVQMRDGDSLARIFQRHGLKQSDLLNMTRSSKALSRRLRRLRVGQQVWFEVLPEGEVTRLILKTPGPTDEVVEAQSPGKYTMHARADILAVPAAHDSAPSPVQRPTQRKSAGRDLPAPAPLTPKSPTMDSINAASPTTPQPSLNAEQEEIDSRSRQITVKTGDSLYAIFIREGIPARDLATLLRSDKTNALSRHLRPGQNLALSLSATNTVRSITLAVDETRTFTAVRTGGASFTTSISTYPLERRIATASAVIEDALFLAGQRAGLSDRVIMEMIEIFGWDVDFALDVRAGDHFMVIYEELFKDGEKVRDGKILASEFRNRGRSIRAVRYAKKEGSGEYFSPEGFSMRKAFLRTPVKFSRISSRFTRGRMHPVLQRMRAHKGVDYAAPRGTPIKAAGHGRVASSGRKGGYGKTVVLQHGGTYTTLYAHLSRIHPRAKAGKRVKQGEIIGYVGTTGLATGPHLHYEFRVRGVHKDPLRVTLPKALPIDRRYKNDFLVKTRPLVKQLDVLAKTSIASSN
jgi:murein DD-endopeptidase MepM/ murein hydrolase activator NlpD